MDQTEGSLRSSVDQQRTIEPSPEGRDYSNLIENADKKNQELGGRFLVEIGPDLRILIAPLMGLSVPSVLGESTITELEITNQKLGGIDRKRGPVIWDGNQKAIDLLVSNVYPNKPYDKAKLIQDLQAADFQPERDLRRANSPNEWEVHFKASEYIAKQLHERDLRRLEEEQKREKVQEETDKRALDLLSGSSQEPQN